MSAVSSMPTFLGWALSFFDLCPGIFQGHGSVEHRFAGARIGIDAEVPETLELIAASHGGIGQRRFEFATGQHLQRMRIEVRGKVLSLFGFVRIFLGEKVFVEAHFSVGRMRGRNPVDCRLHFAPVRSVSAPSSRIIGAVNFDDLTFGIFHHAGAGDEVASAQTHLASRRQAGNTASAASPGSRPARCRARARTEPFACRPPDLRDC